MSKSITIPQGKNLASEVAKPETEAERFDRIQKAAYYRYLKWQAETGGIFTDDDERNRNWAEAEKEVNGE